MSERRQAALLATLLFSLVGAACGSSSARDSGPSQAKVLPANATPLEKLVAGAIEQTTYTFAYDPSYVKIDYPMGDVSIDRGVCSDVVVRAFRKAGVDLQQMVHEDMKRNFHLYPNKWGAKRPDRNIDHRRVANLMAFFDRSRRSLPITARAEDYRPGDVVAWDLGNGLLHIGILSDKESIQGRYQIVHNIGAGARLEDVLFGWRVIGHYRCL